MTVFNSRRFLAFARTAWSEFQDDHILDGAAVLAFFFVLAAFPAAIFILSLLPFLSIPHLQHAMGDLLRQILPAQSANLFESTVHTVTAARKKGLLTFGFIFALWSASAGVYAFMQQLNRICDTNETRPFWKARGLAILLTLLFAALAIAALSVVIFGGAAQSWVASLIGWSAPLRFFFATLRWVILAAALLFALAVSYWAGPDTHVEFRFISPGNVVAAALIGIASFGFQFYVARFGNYDATYGNLAAIILLMMWMYITGIVLLLGSEINAIVYRRKSELSHANHHGI